MAKAKAAKPATRPASSSAADIKAFIAEQRALGQSKLERARVVMQARKRGELKTLAYEGDPLAGATFSGDPIDDLNAAVGAVAKAVTDELGGATADPTTIDPEQAERIASNKARAKATKAVWKRTTDRSFYFCVVFDAGNQAKAFLEALRVQGKLMQTGDLFIDGRNLADALGVKIPEPEYPMVASLKEPKNTRTKRAKKIGKG